MLNKAKHKTRLTQKVKQNTQEMQTKQVSFVARFCDE